MRLGVEEAELLRSTRWELPGAPECGDARHAERSGAPSEFVELFFSQLGLPEDGFECASGQVARMNRYVCLPSVGMTEHHMRAGLPPDHETGPLQLRQNFTRLARHRPEYGASKTGRRRTDARSRRWRAFRQAIVEPGQPQQHGPLRCLAHGLSNRSSAHVRSSSLPENRNRELVRRRPQGPSTDRSSGSGNQQLELPRVRGVSQRSECHAHLPCFWLAGTRRRTCTARAACEGEGRMGVSLSCSTTSEIRRASGQH